MALTSTRTASKVGSKAAKAAARSLGNVVRNPASVAGIANLAPDELTNPGVQRALARMGMPFGAQGNTGFVNGGPLAARGISGMTSVANLTAPATVAESAVGQIAPSGFPRGVTPPSAPISEPIIPPASGAGAAGNTATKTGRIAGMLSWNPSAARAAAQAGEAYIPGGALAPGSLGRAGLYGLGGYMGANLLHGIVGERNGTWDDAAEGALKGGGIGAGIGSMILPGVGTAVGGALGGIGGAVWGGLTGNDSPSKERDDYLASQVDPSNDKSLISLMSKYGLSTDAQHSLLMQLEIIGPTLGSRDEAKALVQQVMGNLPALIEQDKAQQVQASRAAAMQAYLLPMMQQSQQQSDRFIQDQATRMNEAASRMSPSVADIYRQHAADLVGSNTRSYQAQLTQMLLAPQLYQQSAQYGVANPAADAYAAVGAGTGVGYNPAG